MSDEYRPLELPSFNINNNDPVWAMMVKRKKQEETGQLPTPDEYNKREVQELQDFCAKYGILGLDFRGMNPKAVLRMLKNKMGVIESGVPASPTSKTLLKG